MTDSSLSAVFFSEPRGVLVLRADTPVGQALTLSLAQPNARLALSCQTENSTLWETTAQTLQAGAIALPLEKTGVFDPDSSETLVERVVEDFGRLDLVVFPLVSEGEDRTVLKETIMEEITHLACAARPLLRRARPTGFFLIVSNTPLPTGFSLEQEAENLSREIATGPLGRPRVLALDLQTVPQETLTRPETLDRLRARIRDILDKPSPTGNLSALNGKEKESNQQK